GVAVEDDLSRVRRKDVGGRGASKLGVRDAGAAVTMYPRAVTPVDDARGSVGEADPRRSRQDEEGAPARTVEAADDCRPVTPQHLGTREDHAELHAPHESRTLALRLGDGPTVTECCRSGATRS